MTITKDNYEKQASRIAHLTADNLVAIDNSRDAIKKTMNEYGFEFDCGCYITHMFHELTDEIIDEICDTNLADEMENEND